MSRYKVYSKDGGVRCEASSLEYHGEWLGACNVTLTISSFAPIDFRIGDYMDYRGERFTINYDPSELKQASRDSYGEAFKYENVVFNSYSDELTRCMFLDYVKDDNQVHYSSLPVFSFYAEDITYLADRIQVNLDRIYTGDEQWTVEVHPEYVNVTNRNISVSGVNVWDALALVKSEFDANFIIRGRKIIIGTEGIAVGKLFSYGKGNGLYSIQKSAESEQAIVTRLRAYGSTKNMPLSYYKDVTTKCLFPPHELLTVSDERLTIRTFTSLEDCFTQEWDGDEGYYRAKVKIGNVVATAKVLVYSDFSVTLDINTDTYNTSAVVKGIVDAYRADSERVELVSGVNKSKYPLDYVETSPIPNNMAINNLMLPSFPNESLDPCIDSANIDELGIREGTIFFDGSGDLEEIYPTIEGLTAEDLKSAGVPVASSGALDEVVSSEQVGDDGTANEGDKATFTITIKDVGFDINDYVSGDGGAAISMTSGMCGGREFTIAKCERVGDNYELTCERVKDETIGLYFPYNYYNIAAGDTFVLLNIEMPDVYVKAASERLLSAATEWLSKNDYTRYIYEPKVDEIFMARQHEEAIATNGVSIHDTIKEGDLMLFEDDDLGIDGSIIINSLTIKENGSSVPTYEVVLREDKAVGTIQKIQNQIDSIVKHGVSGGGYNSQQIHQFIKTFGDKYFINKTKDDRSVGTIASDKGFEVGEYTDGVLGSGAAMYMDEHGSTHIVSDFLQIRKKATFTTISVQELKHVGGEIILSPAAMVCSKVEETVTGWKCYFNTTDSDGRKIYNEFEVGDFARCQTFNLEKSKYYWRKVEAKGTDYIVLSKSYCDESVENDVPEVGDNISQCGNDNDPDRQSAIILSAYGVDAPSYKQYKGIDRFELSADMLVTKLSPNGNLIKGNFVSESTGKSINDDIENVKVEWDKILQQTDKEFTMWFFDYVPTLDNMPAVEWSSDELKLLHEQDLFFNTSSDLSQGGRAYRFELRDGVWGWYDVNDADTIKALENAYKAQQTADSKMRNFVEQPVPPYDKGDRWCNATYEGLYDDDDLVCITPKADGEVFDIADWQPASATRAYIKNLGDEIGLVAEGLDGAKAEIAASVKYVVDEETGEKVVESDVVVEADKIRFKGKVIIEGKFSVDEDGNVTLTNLTANDGVFNGVINANGGTIGGFTINENTLYTKQGEGNGRIVLEVSTNTGVFINNGEGEPLFVARNDNGTIMRLYSQGNGAKALELVCNAQGNGTALESTGNSSLIARYAGVATPHELVNMAGLALSTRSGTTFHATSSDEVDSWTDFLVADGDIELPDAKECKGKILFVKAKGNIVCPESTGGIVKADETSPVVVRDGNNHSLIYISNGEHWYEFYCG